jgi:transglutaminase-like putative cysteine protease
MSIRVALRHVTHYDRPVTIGPQVVRLRPAPYCRSNVLSYSLGIEPKEHFINWQQDPQSHYLARLVFPEKATESRVEVDLVVEMAVYNPFDFLRFTRKSIVRGRGSSFFPRPPRRHRMTSTPRHFASATHHAALRSG